MSRNIFIQGLIPISGVYIEYKRSDEGLNIY